MKITPLILSIPPYISTTWKNIISLHTREGAHGFLLAVLLQNGVQIEIPGLDHKTIAAIFEGHALFAKAENELLKGSVQFALPLQGEGGMIDAFGQNIQHNPEQSDLPPLPQAMLQKIALLAKTLGAEALSQFPKSESDCHCIYCQVMNTIREGNHVIEEAEEEVLDEDLRFRNWDIKQTTDKLYIVTNPVNENEHYNVFLGEPLGCTCGHKNCEHIRAVLNT